MCEMLNLRSIYLGSNLLPKGVFCFLFVICYLACHTCRLSYEII